MKSALARYGRIYGKSKIFYDKNSGYIKFTSNGELIHRYIYRKKFNLGDGYEVHHIDNDKLNNEIWNLISLKKEDHKIINHGKIDYQNWESGIQQMGAGLGMRDSDFPDHIRKEIKKRKEQTTLKNE